MTMEKDGKEPETGEPGGVPPAGDGPCCGPACGCGTPTGGNRTTKIAASLAVAAAVAAILAYKALRPDPPAKGVDSCPSLASVAALNAVAADRDTVFLVIPGTDNRPLSAESEAALAASEKTLLGKGIRTARYTLSPGSSDYASMAANVHPPGIAVLTKGKGVGTVSGPVTESALMTAYAESTAGGSCCPPGGDSSGKCP
jgi:hypothetical protein